MTRSAGETFSLRPYEPADYDDVLAMFASNTPEFFAKSEAADFAAFLRTPCSESLVAMSSDGGLVGFGAAYCRTPDEGGLAWGMVHRRWHRRGVGQALLNARMAHLWSLDIAQIRVQTSQHSAGFFARSGFEIAAVEASGFAPGIDQVTMVCRRAPTSPD